MEKQRYEDQEGDSLLQVDTAVEETAMVTELRRICDLFSDEEMQVGHLVGF